MFYKVTSGGIWGMNPYIVTVEADVANGMPYFNMVGMLSSEVKEAKERVRSALKNSGFRVAPQRITVNLSPADRKKEGAAFDLPIAVAILRAMGMISEKRLENALVIGELGLNGRVKPVRGVLPIVLEAKKAGVSACIVPVENYREAMEVDGMHIIPVRDLNQVADYINKGIVEEYVFTEDKVVYQDMEVPDFSEVQGNLTARRAAEIAAAGNHNLLMIGPPGAGKSMIAGRIPGILPSISREERLEILGIYSVCGLLKSGETINTRPFRSPHHTITLQGMTGGGTYPRPGELSLAHRGVLFLDEVTEFNPAVLDTLRQPLETGQLIITRTSGTYIFDTDCMVVAAMNPCKCGYYPDRSRCICTEEEVKKYMGRISGAILDRMDMCVEVPAVKYQELRGEQSPESSADIRKRVERAVDIQRQRYEKNGISRNAKLSSKDIQKFCSLDGKGERMIKNIFEKFNLTVRGYLKILKVARTIADLDGCRDIKEHHLAEAVIYKTADRYYR